MRRNPQPDLSLISETDWARIAAYIDGEGHISIASQVHKAPFEGRGRYGYASISVVNCDPRLPQWLMKNCGGSIQMRKGGQLWKGVPQNSRPSFNWVLCNQRASMVLKFCLPYFILKREQAELAIAFQATCIRCGVKGTPQHVLDKRDVIKAQLKALTKRGPRTDEVTVN